MFSIMIRYYMNWVFLIIVLTFVCPMVVAQRANDQRTLTTKIIDILAEMPAKGAKLLDHNMREIAAMGEEGLVAMAGMLAAPGHGDNTGLEYALGGYSYYVMKNGNEELRQICAKAYSIALGNAKSSEARAFLIAQLQIIGNDDMASCLSTYLNDSFLCDDVSRALVSINSSGSEKALLQALKNSQNRCLLSVIKSLGEIKSKDALIAITPYAHSNDEDLRKTAFFAIANIADLSSTKLLANAAREAGFTFSNNNATGAYILYIQRLLEKGEKKEAKRIADSLLKYSKTQVHTRIAALKLLVDIDGENSIPLLVKSSGDNNSEFRAAALKLAMPYVNDRNISLWAKSISKSDAQIQSEIVAMLGTTGLESALPLAKKALENKNQQVRLAGIKSVGKLGQQNSLPDLLLLMKQGRSQEVEAIKETILIIKGENVIDIIADALPSMPLNAQVELIRILGARAASKRIDVVFAFVKNQHDEVRMAALSALASLATFESLPQLFSLLNEMSLPNEIVAIQQAITTVAEHFSDKSHLERLLIQEMNTISDDKKHFFFKILAVAGGKDALNLVSSAFQTGNDIIKNEALSALTRWYNEEALGELFNICNNEAYSEYLDQALIGYILTISRSKYPADQKLLLQRKAMGVAKTVQQKKLLLKEIEKNKTFPALVFAGRYIEQKGLEQDAAHVVMNISLSGKGFNGPVVRDLLQKTLNILNGPDSEYHKEAINKFLNEMPKDEGIVQLFNGKDLSGWKGVVTNPIERSKMDKKLLTKQQAIEDEKMHKSWRADNEELVFLGKSDNIATDKKYGDFELFLDWKINDSHEKADAGLFLRGIPQVQIGGTESGSGGLINNKLHANSPLKVADNEIGEWNSFRILMKGDRATIYLNGELVTDNVIVENFWNSDLPIFDKGQIVLHVYNSRMAFRDIYIREIPRPEPFVLSDVEKQEGFKVLFDGTNMHHWQGNTSDYIIENGEIVVHKPKFGSGGNLFTKEEYGDFIFRFEFKLTPGANNGLGIRAPLKGDAAYVGMELQILDNEADIYKNLSDYQFHGSVYGVIPAKRGFLKPVGEWNYQEVIVKGTKIKVILNGTTILDGDIAEASKNGTLDGKDHPGLKRNKGFIGFLGHGSTVWFRNIRIKDLSR
jgi:HEAT repeat protein